MKLSVMATIAALGLASAGAASAAPVKWVRMDPGAYQTFVINWSPADQPLCAVIDSKAKWEAVMHPAPVMFSKQRFGPPGEFFNTHMVLLVARVMPGADHSHVFEPLAVAREGGATLVRYRYAAPPAASYQIKWPLILAVDKPVAGHVIGPVTFEENGKAVCTVDAGGAWMAPPLAAKP